MSDLCVFINGVLVRTHEGVDADIEELAHWKRLFDYNCRVYGFDITGKWLMANPSKARD